MIYVFFQTFSYFKILDWNIYIYIDICITKFNITIINMIIFKYIYILLYFWSIRKIFDLLK